jgi:hypothetical protein
VQRGRNRRLKELARRLELSDFIRLQSAQGNSFLAIVLL